MGLGDVACSRCRAGEHHPVQGGATFSTSTDE